MKMNDDGYFYTHCCRPAVIPTQIVNKMPTHRILSVLASCDFVSELNDSELMSLCFTPTVYIFSTVNVFFLN